MGYLLTRFHSKRDVKIAFQIMTNVKKALNSYQFINCHMVFDIKIEDSCRKACLVVGGHVTYMPKVITYSSVVTRETVHIALIMVALHDLEVKAADILNSFVLALNMGKEWTTLSPKFGDDAGKSAIIVKASYRLKVWVLPLEYIVHSSCKN